MENYFNSKSIFILINKWKYHLIIVAIVAAAISAVFSAPFFIKPKFKSNAILYPVNIVPVSEESQTEQMLQIIQSMDIRNQIFTTFHLAKHYEIDTTQKYWFTYLNKEFDGNVSFRKTEYESVEIEVYDTNPQIASDIVDSIITFYNKKIKSLYSGKSAEVVVIAKNQLDKKLNEVDSLEKRLNEFNVKYGLVDYKIQAKEYIRLLNSGKNSKEATDVLKNIKEVGDEYLATDSLLWSCRKVSYGYRLYYENSLRDVQKELTYSHIISAPFPSDKKAYPIRWLIVLMGVTASLFIALIAIAIIETKNHNSN